MVSVVIHTNMTLENQRETAGWLQQGFANHGIQAKVTADKYKPADIHVIQGPWYAYKEWVGKDNVLWLDRTFYGHPRFSISLGWLNPDGSRDFRLDGITEGKGDLPELKPRKEKQRSAIVFGDYGRDPEEEIYLARKNYDSVFFRSHPQERRVCRLMELDMTLPQLWDFADVAVGHSSTVLVDAEINGLHTHSTDPRHVVNTLNGSRQLWLNRLSWCIWDHEELKRGDFWEHLH